MELRHLRYFVAVAESLHFGRAAREQGVSQPTLSAQVRALEAELGFALLERRARGVTLTPAGAAFLEEARAALRHADDAVRQAAAAHRGERGVLRVGHVDAGADAGRLVRLLSRYRALHPAVRVELTLLASQQQLEWLRIGRLDVGVVYAGGPEPEGLAVEWFAESPLDGVLVAADAPVASRATLSLGELAALPLLLFPRQINPPLHDALLDGLRLRGAASPLFPPLTDPAAPGMGLTPLLLAIVAAGHAWLPTSRRMAASYHAIPGAVFRPFVEPAVPFGLALAWRADDDAPPVAAFRAQADAVRRENGMEAGPG